VQLLVVEPAKAKAADPRWWQAALLVAVSVALYLRTMAPGLTFGDAGDLATAAYQLGVPHPTGYPLYTLLGALWIRLIPLHDPAWRMNLLSAACASLAVGALYLAALEFLSSRRAAALAAGVFAVCPTFWSQAVITEVYALHVLLVALFLLTLARYRSEPTTRRGVHVALIYGCMLAHHLLSIWLLPGIVAYLLMLRQGARERPVRLGWGWTALVPLLMYAYLPWAALRDPPWNWGDPRTPQRFVAHLTGALYRDKMVRPSASGVGARLSGYLGLRHGSEFAASAQFPWIILWLAPLGLIRLARRRPDVSLMVILWYIAVLLWSALYSIRDIEAYFLTAHMITALWLAEGVEVLVQVSRALAMRASGSERWHLWLARGTTGLAVCTVLISGTANLAGADRSQDTAAIVRGRSVLETLPANALLVLSGDTWGFPAAYCRYVLGIRPDVRLLFYRDFLDPEYRRLVERERANGLKVPLREPGVTRNDGMRWLKAVLDANMPERPCYLAGDAFAEMQQTGILSATLGPIRSIVPDLPVYARTAR
jgi:hypothetical protein